eukprot:scaffold34690_cov288-Amphora_coffeaeformis.AAC.4
MPSTTRLNWPLIIAAVVCVVATRMRKSGVNAKDLIVVPDWLQGPVHQGKDFAQSMFYKVMGIDPSKPYYPSVADRYLEVGVKQLFDPTLWTLEEYESELELSLKYIKSNQDDKEYAQTVPKCVFKDSNCLSMAVKGRCFNETSPNNGKDFFHMSTHCCPACESLADYQFFEQCPIDPTVHNHYTKPGQLSETFLALLRNLTEQNMEFKLHAAPINNVPSDLVDYEYKEGPWIVTIENFTTEKEAETLIHHGTEAGYYRSQDGITNPDGSWRLGKVKWRTSWEQYCDRESCHKDPVVENLMDRIYNVLGIPIQNADWLQLLRYKEGQHYATHQDYHTHQASAKPGARVVTWYMYLADVEEGGETQFPYMDIKVKPKLGRVLVWSNIRDDDPMEENLFARHEALPVVKGTKYGATAWYHHRNIREVEDACRN